jgi:REP element-mobilizing transposase RayT
MTRPRSMLVSVSDTPWYHVVSRCVRRAFLCGADAYSGQSFEHRRGWIVSRVKQLAGIFAIDVAAFAVMSNHYHLVVRIDTTRAKAWSREEVLRRWTLLFDGPLAVQKLMAGQAKTLDAATHKAIDGWAEMYRTRLCELSWFMRVLNESIARRANAEDNVTGRFWEGRFRSQALLDEQAVLAAMAYVDLNPIRAGMAETPDTSDYTSVGERIGELKNEGKPETRPSPPAAHDERPRTPVVSMSTSTSALRVERQLDQLPQQPLMPFDATARLHAAIPFAFDDYLELVETAGRCIRRGKRGAISEHTPRLLERLSIDPECFIDCAMRLMRDFGSAVGAPEHLTELCAARQVKYLRGTSAAKAAFGTRHAGC